MSHGTPSRDQQPWGHSYKPRRKMCILCISAESHHTWETELVIRSGKNDAMAHFDSPEFAVTAALSRFLMGLSFTIALVLVDYSHGADIINKKRLLVMKVAVKHCCVVPRSRCLG